MFRDICCVAACVAVSVAVNVAVSVAVIVLCVWVSSGKPLDVEKRGIDVEKK